MTAKCSIPYKYCYLSAGCDAHSSSRYNDNSTARCRPEQGHTALKREAGRGLYPSILSRPPVFRDGYSEIRVP